MKHVQPAWPVHGTIAPLPSTMLQSPLQQSPAAVQDWPSSAQVLLPLPLPPQVPNVEPPVKMQLSPLQQSALWVHIPSVFTHPEPQYRLPLPSGTQGSPLQQSPENAQDEPCI